MLCNIVGQDSVILSELDKVTRAWLPDWICVQSHCRLLSNMFRVKIRKPLSSGNEDSNFQRWTEGRLRLRLEGFGFSSTGRGSFECESKT